MKRKLFFDEQFSEIFEIRSQTLRLGSVLPANRNQIAESLKFMSTESIRNRFLGSKKDFSTEELNYYTELDGFNHYAIGIEEVADNHQGVAVIRLVRSESDPSEGEIAITIIDRFQNIGLGTILMKLMVLAASEREYQRLSFTFLPHNDVIIKLIQKIGVPYAGEQNRDYHQQLLNLKDVDLTLLKSQLVKILPGIDTFHLKT